MSRHGGQHRHAPVSRSKSPAVVARAVATHAMEADPAALPLHAPVLVLNASYEPINICAARRALVLVLKGVASAEEVTSHAVHSTRRTVSLPSVIRLLEYRRIPHQTRSLSRKIGRAHV